jgi:hypothetical protein
MEIDREVVISYTTPKDAADEVVRQVNRPTFERVNPPLVEVCRYISFEGLREALAPRRTSSRS